MVEQSEHYDESFLRVLQAYKSLNSGIRSATGDPPAPTSLSSLKVIIEPHGTSIWSRTFKLTVRDNSADTSADYFLKTAVGANGRIMMSGEFDSMTAIHRVTPAFCPFPIGWGTYDNDPNRHFFLCEFVAMGNAPSTYRNDTLYIKDFTSNLARLHKESVSPTGKFGFDVQTCNGNIPQDNTWDDSWERFFVNGFRHMLNQYERVIKKVDDELRDLEVVFLGKVVPRLLRPLETGGRSVKPSLVHGDLWFGNSAVATGRGKATTMVFDACCFYAHNEYELGNWRPGRNKFPQKYFKAYLEAVGGKSEPVADFNDRNILYSIRFNLHAAILFPQTTGYRTLVVDDMNALNKKFKDFNISTLEV
ncbi:hypothetical protein BJ508DRAFT_111685 [Ascobolus immersus RN42]|uniref:protein-ribulosamine 3-kinase n=1 Tax=Ascobolus immersus RN42 TaxID=1160509 RepID=A0A3N4I6C5_ASCIM|nr:hypothetical protein BJ508DRAFT_111685 [Ascobolus immersus RN42]